MALIRTDATKFNYFGETKINLDTDTVISSNDIMVGKIGHLNNGQVVDGTATSDATAIREHILNDETAYVNGNKITGRMPNNGTITRALSTPDASYTIPQGYHSGNGTVSIYQPAITDCISGNIKEGSSILGISGSLLDYSTFPMYCIDYHISHNTPATDVQTLTLPDGAAEKLENRPIQLLIVVAESPSVLNTFYTTSSTSTSSLLVGIYTKTVGLLPGASNSHYYMISSRPRLSSGRAYANHSVATTSNYFSLNNENQLSTGGATISARPYFRAGVSYGILIGG